MLLDGQIPYIPGVGAVVAQYRFLGSRRNQPIPRHANILANITDIYGEVKWRVVLGLKTGVSTLRSL
jgi:hypothetical protein